MDVTANESQELGCVVNLLQMDYFFTLKSSLLSGGLLRCISNCSDFNKTLLNYLFYIILENLCGKSKKSAERTRATRLVGTESGMAPLQSTD